MRPSQGRRIVLATAARPWDALRRPVVAPRSAARAPAWTTTTRLLATSAAFERSTQCPHCGASMKCCTLLCPQCHKVLSPSGQPDCPSCNHFDLLGLPTTYNIDVKQLERRFKALQMDLHPDKFSRASESQHELSADASTRLNEAFATLKSPMLRAKYLLESKGVDPFSEDGKTPTDMKILTEAMELREELDVLATQAEVDAFAKRVGERTKAVELELASALGDTQQLDYAVTLAVRLRYLESILEEARHKAPTTSSSSSTS